TPKNVCLVLAYGQDKTGALAPQTKDRCLIAANLYKQKKVSEFYLTCACSSASRNMATEMSLCLQEAGVGEKNIRVLPFGLNTTGEIEIFLEATPNCRHYVTSSWYHILRVLWLFVTKKSWARPSWTWTCARCDLSIEPVKLAKDIIWLGRDSKRILL
ncbi:MAG TPA: ElyC/SanA/YdcF family protein, partial [Candidatus Paceibacterota bacterium]|nr:ElyC/SanA/YdcF family protein [Candidatus Paceibacterota bacterium]